MKLTPVAEPARAGGVEALAAGVGNAAAALPRDQVAERRDGDGVQPRRDIEHQDLSIDRRGARCCMAPRVIVAAVLAPVPVAAEHLDPRGSRKDHAAGLAAVEGAAAARVCSTISSPSWGSSLIVDSCESLEGRSGHARQGHPDEPAAPVGVLELLAVDAIAVT